MAQYISRAKLFWRSCGNKQRHSSLGKAQAALRAHVARFPSDHGKMVAYVCLFCQQWHIGHRKGINSR